MAYMCKKGVFRMVKKDHFKKAESTLIYVACVVCCEPFTFVEKVLQFFTLC